MVIKRWSTTPCINRQDIAQHSFYVVLYTDHITQLLGWSPARKYEAMHWAVIHDMPETVTSDIPGPVKRTITNKPALEAVEDQLMKEFGAGYNYDRSDWMIRDVVKAANLIDEVFYLHSEVLLGNGYLDRVFDNSWGRMKTAVKKLDVLSASPMGSKISSVIVSEVRVSLDQMRGGVVGLVNDDDLNG